MQQFSMKIFCSGIGGIGLSAYAALQRTAGHDVAGSDRSDSPLVDDLRSQGISVHLSQDGSGVSHAVELFVYSEAVPADAPERLRALELGIRSLSYFHALGELAAPYDVIAVCGTHGKSSTTAMAARLLVQAGLDPTVVVGTKAAELGGRNWRRGKGKIFLVEACEYRRNFQHLHPLIALLTNVDGDHFDAFKDRVEYQKAFEEFLHVETPRRDASTIICHGKDPDSRRIAELSGRTVVDADGQPLIPLQTPGLHMRQNAQLVLALAGVLKIDLEEAKDILSGFSGTWRRMEVKGVWGDDVVVVDDYAHHPVEIRATLAAMRERCPDRRIVCAFQPHTHDRTIKFYDDFLSAFTDANVVIVPNVFGARRDVDASETVDVDTFVTDMAKGSNVEALNGRSLQETRIMLEREVLKPHDLLVCMGAGDITTLASAMAASS